MKSKITASFCEKNPNPTTTESQAGTGQSTRCRCWGFQVFRLERNRGVGGFVWNAVEGRDVYILVL